MIVPPLTSLPHLILGQGSGIHIMALDDRELATLSQHSLIDLRERSPPAAGYWPPVLIDTSWNQKTQVMPKHVNCLVHIPETEFGDFWGLFAAPTRKTQGQREGRLRVERPRDGTMFWACLSPDLVTAVTYNQYGTIFSQLRMAEPLFLPGTVGFKEWIEAAELWLHEYKLPVGEEYVCCCRRRRGVCQVVDSGRFAFGKRMVRDGKGNHTVEPLMREEKTMECQAGERCPYREYHLACLGILVERQEDVWLEGEWWCPVCRVRYPEEARSGVIVPGERLELRERYGDLVGVVGSREPLVH